MKQFCSMSEFVTCVNPGDPNYDFTIHFFAHQVIFPSEKIRNDQKEENLRTFLHKPCINGIDISLLIVLRLAPRVHGELACLVLRVIHGVLYLLHRVQQCCLATVILPALTLLQPSDLTIEGSLRVRFSFFSFFNALSGNKERRSKWDERNTITSNAQKLWLMVENARVPCTHPAHD